MKIEVFATYDGPRIRVDTSEVTAMTIKRHKSLIHARGTVYGGSIAAAYDVLAAHDWFVKVGTDPNPHYVRK